MTQPKEVLVSALHKHITEYLKSLNFVFSESQLKYIRSENDFKQEISFKGSKNNTAFSIINFESNFSIYSGQYKKWHSLNFPELPIIGAGYISGDMTVWENYDQSFLGFGYDFIKHDHEIMMLHLLKNIQNVALPYFEQNNSWSKMAESEIKNPIQKVDTLILAQKISNAYSYCCSSLEVMEGKYKETSNANLLQTITYLQKRKEFLERISYAHI